MRILRKYINELLAELPQYIATQQGSIPLDDEVQAVNDEIESRHPAHAIPNSEHVEGSIGEALDLISLKKKYGRSRNEHAAQKLLDTWRIAMGAGGGKKGAALAFLLAAGGVALADHIFLGGALTYLGLGGAGLNTIYEVMAGNAADDDLKKYIKWDPEILGWMDDKKEDELEDEWIDLLFEHISNNPQSDLTDFMSINDFANEKLGRPIKGEKIRIKTNELREYIHTLLVEATEYDSQFKILMDSGPEGTKDAMFLADSLGIPSQELPWTEKHVLDYLSYETAGLRAADTSRSTWIKEYKKLLANVSPLLAQPYFETLSPGGLQEATEPVREDRMKVSQLFWATGAGMGIQMAEMTPGLEDLAEKFEEFRVLVEEFIDLSERFMAQGPTNVPLSNNDIGRAKNEIQKAVTKLTWLPSLADKEVISAAKGWERMFTEAARWARWSGTPSPTARSDQEEYEALKDWAVV
jgi:hypothetical protein